MMIVGDGVAASGAQPELRRVVELELVGAEIWGAHSWEVNFAFDHPQFGGLLGHMFGQDSARIVNRADAPLICGTYCLLSLSFRRSTRPWTASRRGW